MGRPHYSIVICCLSQHDTIHPFCEFFTLSMTPSSTIWSSSSLNILCRRTGTAQGAWTTSSALGSNTMWYGFKLKAPSPSKRSWKSLISLSLVMGIYTCFYSVDCRLQFTLIRSSPPHVLGKVCIRTKWAFRPELIPHVLYPSIAGPGASVTCSEG